MKALSSDKLKDISFFSGLNDETLKYIEKNSKVLKKKKGEHIFRDKDKVQDIFIVLKGKVTLYKMNEYGQKRIVYILGEESFLNEVIVDDLPASINGEAFENSIILSIDKNKLLNNIFW